MIETAHTVVIVAGIEQVWDYVRDIRRWANLFPGCRECAVIDEHDSRWTIKVGAGGLVKTVTVLVHVDEWAGPERVNFSYKLENEPVVGGGSYKAVRISATETEMTLNVRVEGSGAMAPMWEAVSKPLLPQLAKLFAGSLKAEIESSADETPAAPPSAKLSPFAALRKWLRGVWRAVFGVPAS